MKRFMVVLAAMALVIVMTSGAFAGSTNLNVNSSATVTTICNVNGGTLVFGNVDADSDTTVSAGGGLSIKCTAGTSVTVTDDLGSYESGTQMRMKDAGTNYLPYSINYTKTAMTGKGAGAGGTDLNTDLNLTGTITGAQIAGVPAGSYTDVIQLTIAY